MREEREGRMVVVDVYEVMVARCWWSESKLSVIDESVQCRERERGARETERR